MTKPAETQSTTQNHPPERLPLRQEHPILSAETDNQPTDPRMAEIMSRLVAGDMEAMFDLTDEYGARIRGVVRHIVKATGRTDILNDHDEIAGLTMEAVLLVIRHAPSWNSAGSPPWIWLRTAIKAAIWSGIGHRTIELEEWQQAKKQIQGPGPSPRALGLADVARMARIRPELDLFLRVLNEETSDRDVHVVLEYELQKAEDVRAPSETTAILTGLTAPNVRQIASRAKKKMLARVTTDEELAVLDGFWFLADRI